MLNRFKKMTDDRRGITGKHKIDWETEAERPQTAPDAPHVLFMKNLRAGKAKGVALRNLPARSNPEQVSDRFAGLIR